MVESAKKIKEISFGLLELKMVVLGCFFEEKGHNPLEGKLDKSASMHKVVEN